MSGELSRLQKIQVDLGETPDDIWGPKCDAALEKEKAAARSRRAGARQFVPDEPHSAIASEFADAADIEAFRKCKAQGKSDQDCFRVGDNGIGVWGQSTAPGSGPSCALPPEDIEEAWGSVAAAKNKQVIVTYKDAVGTLILKDRMPHRANIKNGAGIDLNEDARKLLGIPKGGMVRVIWKWA